MSTTSKRYRLLKSMTTEEGYSFLAGEIFVLDGDKFYYHGEEFNLTAKEITYLQAMQPLVVEDIVDMYYVVMQGGQYLEILNADKFDTVFRSDFEKATHFKYKKLAQAMKDLTGGDVVEIKTMLVKSILED